MTLVYGLILLANSLSIRLGFTQTLAQSYLEAASASRFSFFTISKLNDDVLFIFTGLVIVLQIGVVAQPFMSAASEILHAALILRSYKINNPPDSDDTAKMSRSASPSSQTLTTTEEFGNLKRVS